MFHSGSLSTPQDHLKTSVCIVTYNRAATIDLCLRSIENQVTPLDEIIVVDSSDNDDTRRILQQRKIIYKHIEKRLYQPQARNLSLSIAKGDVIAFVDDDVICSPAWLKNIIKGYSYDNVVGVSGPVIRCDETLRPMQEMKISNKNHNFFTFYGDVRVTPTWMPLKPVRTKLMMGGNMSFLKVELKEVGGFDEFYGEGGAYREETDPQIALIRKRYDFMYMPGAIAYHLVHSRGGIRSDNFSDSYYWCGRYHKYFADKYFPKLSTRASWIFWSFDPPCLWLCVCLAVFRRNRHLLGWAKGLWQQRQ